MGTREWGHWGWGQWNEDRDGDTGLGTGWGHRVEDKVVPVPLLESLPPVPRQGLRKGRAGIQELLAGGSTGKALEQPGKAEFQPDPGEQEQPGECGQGWGIPGKGSRGSIPLGAPKEDWDRCFPEGPSHWEF